MWRCDRKGRPTQGCWLLGFFSPKDWQSLRSPMSAVVVLGFHTLRSPSCVYPKCLEHCCSGLSLPKWHAPKASNPSFFSRLRYTWEMSGYTSLSREKLWVCPCLLDSLQLLRRFSFLQVRNGCGMQQASLLHQWQLIPSPADTSSNLQDRHLTSFVKRFGTKKRRSLSMRLGIKRELCLKQGHIPKCDFHLYPCLPTNTH